MTDHKGLPVHGFDDQAAWDAWLAKNGADTAGLWLRLAKRESGVASVSKAEAIETALAHGWIDGLINPLDERFWLIRFTPRKARSRWSKNNRDTAERLIASGRMRPAGMAEVEAARRDGRWDAAYPPQSRAEVPNDLQAALDAEPEAKAFFVTLKGANRYAVLYRIHDAKTAKTRAARIAKFVDMLKRGETVY